MPYSLSLIELTNKNNCASSQKKVVIFHKRIILNKSPRSTIIIIIHFFVILLFFLAILLYKLKLELALARVSFWSVKTALRCTWPFQILVAYIRFSVRISSLHRASLTFQNSISQSIIPFKGLICVFLTFIKKFDYWRFLCYIDEAIISLMRNVHVRGSQILHLRAKRPNPGC